MITEAFGGWSGEPVGHVLDTPTVGAKVRVRERETEQAHLVFGSPSIVRDDDRRYALTLADHVLGGGMSSRLFHEIREERGLAYAVQSFRMPFADAGASAVYVGTTPSQTDEVLTLVRRELDRIITDGITIEELDRAKGNVKGALAIGLEDANSWMNRIGRTELVGMEHHTVDETVAILSAVTLDEVLAAAKASYSGPYVLGAVGPFSSDDLEDHIA